MQITREDDRLTVAEVAALCGVEPITVYQWMYRGYLTRDGSERHHLPFVKEGRRILINVVDAAKAEWHTRERARRGAGPATAVA